jgi:OOP family OmpA-OmpF porin
MVLLLIVTVSAKAQWTQVGPTFGSSLGPNYLKDNKDQKITIVGYACNIGSKEQNITISEQRAKKVNDELIKMGVSSNQLSTKAKGESEPLFPNTSDENRQNNRRVEILFEN